MSRCRHVQLIAAEPGWRVVDSNGHHFHIVAWSLCETGRFEDWEDEPGLVEKRFDFDPMAEGQGLDDRWQVKLEDRRRAIHAVVIGAGGGPDPACVGDLGLREGYLVPPRETLRSAGEVPEREDPPPGSGGSATGSMGTEVGRDQG